MQKSEVEKIIELRKFFLGIICICIVSLGNYFFIPLPDKVDLLKDAGVIEKVNCICSNQRVNGYKFLLNDKVYKLKWLDFYVDRTVVDSMSEGQSVTIFYRPVIFGLFGKKIYAVAGKDKDILEYEFLKSKYSESDAQVKEGLSYFLLISIIVFVVIHFMVRRRQRINGAENLS